MKRLNRLMIAALLVILLRAPIALAAVVGQVDTFEDGTTQGWLVGLLGSPHPTPPVNVPDDGPLGAGDNFLRLTAIGGQGAGSRLAAINTAQWAGDYTDSGISKISMDVKNLGASDLSIRLYLENPVGGPPEDYAVSDAVFLPSGGGWTHAEFAIDPLSLTTLAGDVNTLLANVTALRIFHNPAAAYSGPPVVAMLGVDNITAVPEPSAWLLACVAALGLLAVRRRRVATSQA